MKALTLTQPWATAIALGHKKFETRSFRTNYRGPIAIHAAKGFPEYAHGFARIERSLGRVPERLPLGAFVAVATIIGCRFTEDVAQQVDAIERLYGDYAPGRYAWALADIIALNDPIPCRGMLGLWKIPADVELAIAAQLATTVATVTV